MLTHLTVQSPSFKKRVLRSADIPLTRVTLFCGPNGSGKSSAITAFEEFVLNLREQWTKETAPVLVQGEVTGSVMFFSMEADNPRTKRLDSDELAAVAQHVNAQYVSHGQSNYDMLAGMLGNPRFDVLVLDEPEAALDLDGLLWLREQLLITTQQVILATHSPILLSMMGTRGVSSQSFGANADYDSRVLASYLKVLQGKTVKPLKVRLPKLEFDKKRPSKNTVAAEPTATSTGPAAVAAPPAQTVEERFSR